MAISTGNNQVGAFVLRNADQLGSDRLCGMNRRTADDLGAMTFKIAADIFYVWNRAFLAGLVTFHHTYAARLEQKGHRIQNRPSRLPRFLPADHNALRLQ